MRLLSTFPPRNLPPIWREARTGLELAALVRDPVFRRADPGAGGGRPVMLIPGFLAGDDSLAILAWWLRRQGYRPFPAGMRSNVGCATRALDALEARLEADPADQRVAVIGHSYGGTLARSLAIRRPDLVAGVVTLGAQLVDQLAIHPLARVPVRVVGRLGSLGMPGMFRRECLTGECCREIWDAGGRAFPAGVGFVSVYSRKDGLVDWRACLDPRAKAVEVDASHIGMAVNPTAYRTIAGALRDFAVSARTAAARASGGRRGRRSSRPSARPAA